MNTAITAYRPGLLGGRVFDDIFDSMLDFSSLMNRTTQGYPVADIYRDEDGNTALEFALAGFSKGDLSIEIKPEKNAITVSANQEEDNKKNGTFRIAQRNFSKTYVNYDNNLDLSSTTAEFENGLLRLTIPIKEEAKPLTIAIK